MTTFDMPAADIPPRGRRLHRFLAGVMLVLAVYAPAYGIVYDINGATRAKGDVRVPVSVRDLDRLRVTAADHPITQAQADGSAPAGPATTIALRQYQGADDPGRPLYIAVPDAPDGTYAMSDLSGITLSSWDSTMPEQILARGGQAVICVCIGIGAFMLRRLLLSIGAGRPFEPGNPRRIAVVAGAVAVAGVAPGFLTTAAADLVLQRVHLAGPGSPITAPPAPNLGAILGGLVLPLLVLALAEAFRRGGELTRDVEGLV